MFKLKLFWAFYVAILLRLQDFSYPFGFDFLFVLLWVKLLVKSGRGEPRLITNMNSAFKKSNYHVYTVKLNAVVNIF